MSDKKQRYSEDFFGRNLIFILEEKHMDPKDLARAVGVSVSCVYYWMNNEKNPSLKKAILVANLLDISFDRLIG